MSALLKFIVRLNGFILITFFVLLSGCGGDDGTDEPENPNPPEEPTPLIVTVNTDVTYQTIAGFGGANKMWGTQFLKPAEAKKAFGSDDTDLGLSLFRVRVASNKDEWPLILESVQEAQSYGVKILASPWSPPADLKNNSSDVGGFLLSDNYGAFKDHLNEFITYMANNGVDIYAVSVQNEPDIQVSYESCDWSSIAMNNFIRDYGDSIEGAKLAAPESFHFDQQFSNVILNDSESANNLDIVAGHIYGSGLAPYPLAEQKGKEIWMTEYLMNLNTGNAGSPAWNTYSESEKWDETMTMLSTIHDAMTYNWNAYIWWYIQRYYSFIGDGEFGTANGEILKRGVAFSHFSKYVRPGYVRVDIETSESSNLDITAYEGDGNIVVVILNTGSTSVKNVELDLPSVTSAFAVETSVNDNRESVDTTIDGNKVTLDVRSKSITTIVVKK